MCRAESGSASWDELQRGHVTHPELLADLGADQPFRGLQRGSRALQLLLLAPSTV